MALTFLPGSLVIESDSSILDLPAFHADLRDWEDSAEAAVHPVTHTWKAVDLGGGAFFYALDLINGWRLRFPAAGSYVIQGNLGGEILPVAGVYVERKTSAAYATTAVGGSGPSAADIAAAVWSHLSRTLTSGGSGATPEEIWSFATRTLTAQPIPPTEEEIAAAVWDAMTRTLTSPSGPTSEQIAAAVWDHTQ